MTIKDFIKGSITDVKDRPEPKIILGALLILASVPYLFLVHDAGGFTAMAGMGAGLMTVAAVADSKNDNTPKGQ